MFKVLANNVVIGVVDSPMYVRYQTKNEKFIACEQVYAQGIVSENGQYIWQLEGAPAIPIDGYTCVTLVAIEQEEYDILKTALEANQIVEESQEPVDYVQQATLECVIRGKIKKLSDDCSNIIVNGFDIELSDTNTYHFDLTLEDQVNMIGLKTEIARGVLQIPYHSKGELCRYYSSEDIISILNEAEAFKNYHILYFNSLKNYINSLTDIATINNIIYGDAVPLEYQSPVFKDLVDNEDE